MGWPLLFVLLLCCRGSLFLYKAPHQRRVSRWSLAGSRRWAKIIAARSSGALTGLVVT